MKPKQPTTSKQTTTEWHWEQAIKYAVEAIKTALILNGAAAIAVMTYANAHAPLSRSGIGALVLFALGAVLSAIAFLFSYRTQVFYGNAEQPALDKTRRDALWRQAQALNTVTAYIVVASIVAFVLGVGFGAFAIAQ